MPMVLQNFVSYFIMLIFIICFLAILFTDALPACVPQENDQAWLLQEQLLPVASLYGNDLLSQPIAMPPLDCDTATPGCTVINSYGAWPDRSECRVSEVVFPKTEQELIAAVARGVSKGMKMKVVSRFAHSIPKLVCPGGDSGLLISTGNYSSGIRVDRGSLTVTADSGVELRRLLEEIGNAGLALPASPYWNGLSIGGLISTGAHGSSLWGKGGAVHEFVVGLRMVVPASGEEGFAKVIEITENDHHLLNAAKVSLGVLGVISQVTLALEPMFKRSIVNTQTSDSNVEDMIVEFGKNHEFGDVSWYPSRYRVVLRADNRVPVSVPGDGVNDYIAFQATLATSIESQRLQEESYEETGNSSGRCAAGAANTEGAVFTKGQGFKNSAEGKFTGYPVVGFQHKMQSGGGCLDSSSKGLVCPWDPTIRGLFFHESSISIGLDRVHEFIADVKRLRELVGPDSLCGVDFYNGFLMRYVKASSAYLGLQEDSVFVDMAYFRARHQNTPRLHEDVMEEIEQMAMFKYKGHPHWGKNRIVAFQGVSAKHPSLSKFLSVREKLDPDGLFSSEWSDSVLGISNETRSKLPHCALDGNCICSEDLHCAPAKNYYCRPGRVYHEARVCRFEI